MLEKIFVTIHTAGSQRERDVHCWRWTIFFFSHMRFIFFFWCCWCCRISYKYDREIFLLFPTSSFFLSCNVLAICTRKLWIYLKRKTCLWFRIFSQHGFDCFFAIVTVLREWTIYFCIFTCTHTHTHTCTTNKWASSFLSHFYFISFFFFCCHNEWQKFFLRKRKRHTHRERFTVHILSLYEITQISYKFVLDSHLNGSSLKCIFLKTP